MTRPGWEDAPCGFPQSVVSPDLINRRLVPVVSLWWWSVVVSEAWPTVVVITRVYIVGELGGLG